MLKLKRFEEGVWEDYPGFPGVRFKIRPITLSKAMELRSKVRRKIYVMGPSEIDPSIIKPQLVDDVDDGEFSWSIFDQALEAWEGIEVDGSPTPEEIKKAIFDHEELREFILARARKQVEDEQASLEQERKNLLSLQDG